MTTKLDEAIAATDALDDEEFNALIDYIRATIKTRAAKRNARAATAIKVGTRVRLSATSKPQYLQNQPGEVVEKRQTRVVVKLDNGPMGKFRNARVICQPGSLTVIS